MMMKEHIVDSYGEILYTMGNGCSGGSIGQNTVSSIFPGLLDGIQPSCDYPDSITTGMEVTDCVLLANFYQSPQWLALMTGLTQDQINARKTAINGHVDQTACHGWYNLFGSNNQPGNYTPIGVVNNGPAPSAPSARRRTTACCRPRWSTTRRRTRPARAAATPTCRDGVGHHGRRDRRHPRRCRRRTTWASSTA